LAACDELGLGFLPFYPLANGLLTGKVRPGEPLPEGTRLATMPAERSVHWLSDEFQNRVSALLRYAEEIDIPILSLAFSWLLSHHQVGSVIAGASSADQVRANVNAVRELSAAHIERLNELTRVTPQRNVHDIFSGDRGEAMAVEIDPHALDGFEKDSFSADGQTHDVYRVGAGPAVIVIHEIPGITPLVAAFARKVAERGMTAVDAEPLRHARSPDAGSYVMAEMARACVSREFTTLALGKTSPITRFLRELASARVHHVRWPGRGGRRDVPHRRVRPRHEPSTRS
jgi:hypothetical protein